MWRALAGAVVGAGAGYMIWDLAWNARNACFSANEPTMIPTPPGSTDQQAIAIAQQNYENGNRVDGQCNEQHPFAYAIGDGPFGLQWMGVAAIGLLVGGVAGHYALRHVG